MGIVLAFILVPPSVFSTIPKSRQKGKNSNLGNCYVTLMHSIQERPGNHHYLSRVATSLVCIHLQHYLVFSNNLSGWTKQAKHIKNTTENACVNGVCVATSYFRVCFLHCISFMKNLSWSRKPMYTLWKCTAKRKMHAKTGYCNSVLTSFILFYVVHNLDHYTLYNFG